jgi:hypothetical protein
MVRREHLKVFGLFLKEHRKDLNDRVLPKRLRGVERATAVKQLGRDEWDAMTLVQHLYWLSYFELGPVDASVGDEVVGEGGDDGMVEVEALLEALLDPPEQAVEPVSIGASSSSNQPAKKAPGQPKVTVAVWDPAITKSTKWNRIGAVRSSLRDAAGGREDSESLALAVLACVPRDVLQLVAEPRAKPRAEPQAKTSQDATRRSKPPPWQTTILRSSSQT